jgi:pSer/pThr/pTyr-binding forkhead associated (FHA) protein
VNFPAAMRLGSLEILAVVATFGAVTSRIAPARSNTLRANALRLRLLIRSGSSFDGPTGTQSMVIAKERPGILGRSSDANVEIADAEVSRRHACLQYDRGIPYLRDLGSRNGTYLNGKAVFDEGIEVRVGDDIDVGNTRVTVTEMEPATWT